MSRAYFKSQIVDFVQENSSKVLGELNLGGIEFSTQHNDVNISWSSFIPILQSSLRSLLENMPQASKWWLLLEYEIPRLGSRIDAVLLASDIIFVIEYKDERAKFESADIRQVEDYALDLFDFHLQSRGKTIIPILLAPKAKNSDFILSERSAGDVKACCKANTIDLPNLILESFKAYSNPEAPTIDAELWEQSEYKPTPTIIQAAKALFAGQKVEAITKTEAEAANIQLVTDYIIQVIKDAKSNRKKVICFVTGVPGAGKTLVGLNVVHERQQFGGEEFNTAYFSGNVPLIKVLRAALTNDHFRREQLRYKRHITKQKPSKSQSEHEVKAKIQNLHLFIKDGLRSTKAPNEQIVVFDEAQRCWDATHFYNKSVQNRNREIQPFSIVKKSEAEILFEMMDRHQDWAAIIALVGSGQEINTGEAGIAEWGRVLSSRFKDWEVHISPQLLTGSDVTAGIKLFSEETDRIRVFENPRLHLAVSQRSFRATHLNAWVNAVLENQPKVASHEALAISLQYPLLITRDLQQAKNWLRSNVQGTKRCGLVASSGAVRLKSHGVNVKEQIDEAVWFLNDEKDVRSSYYLEIAATEFAVQGLELDWVGICWDADLRRNKKAWDFKSFTGTKWHNVNQDSEKQYFLNKYRVLLTRAREGLIIWVPEGDPKDETRLPDFYDPIFEYLKECGAKEL